MKLEEKYKKEILPALKKELGEVNDLNVPKIVKVVVNSSFGRNSKDKVYVKNVFASLERIAGQKPVATKAKKSISAFKIRDGMVIGAMVTLRGERMWSFLDKMFVVVFPNIRDFRGINVSVVDNCGNITIGFKDHLAFPEIRNDEVDKLHGLEVSVHTTAKDKKAGMTLFKMMGFPFKNN